MNIRLLVKIVFQSKTKMALQDQLKNLNANGKSEDALKQLSEKLRGTEEGNIISLLQSRWTNNERAHIRGVLDNDVYNIEQIKINRALLSVISDLDNAGDVEHGDEIGGDKVVGEKITNNDNRVTSESKNFSPTETEADNPVGKPETSFENTINEEEKPFKIGDEEEVSIEFKDSLRSENTIETRTNGQ